MAQVYRSRRSDLDVVRACPRHREWRALRSGVQDRAEGRDTALAVFARGREQGRIGQGCAYVWRLDRRHRAQTGGRKLRESEERLRRAIEIETVGVIFFKTDGSITNANDAFLRMSGYSREDLAEGLVRWDEMTPPEWMPHSLKAIKEFESTGRTIPYEKEFVRKDGSRWWALFAARRLDEEEGVEFVIDITQSKRAEEELRKSGERITNILESITDAFVAVDRKWRFTYINERALTILQRTREELLGKNMWEEFSEAVELPAYPEYHRAMMSGNSVHLEEFNPWLDIWVEINAYPSEGSLAAYFRDISERKQAEERLGYQAHLLENIQDAVMATDEHFSLTAWNKGAEQMFGWRADEVLGHEVYEVVSSAYSEEQLAQLLRELSE